MSLKNILHQQTDQELFSRTKSWHHCDFIPEVRFENENIPRSFRLFESDLKVAIVNYFDLKNRRSRNDRIKEIRKELGKTKLILSGIGNDRNLDNLSVEDYHKTAIEINADAVTTVDDYIYSTDDEYSNFQLRNSCRLRSRSRKLIELADANYSVIGLVVGKNINGINSHINFLAQCGITDFAFPCGDLFKNNKVHQLELVKTFLNVTKDLGGWRLLLGVNSKVLSRLKFNCYSSSQWSYDAYHHRIYKGERKISSRKMTLKHPKFNNEPIEIQIAIHNLTECHKRAKDLVE